MTNQTPMGSGSRSKLNPSTWSGSPVRIIRSRCGFVVLGGGPVNGQWRSDAWTRVAAPRSPQAGAWTGR